MELKYQEINSLKDYMKDKVKIGDADISEMINKKNRELVIAMRLEENVEFTNNQKKKTKLRKGDYLIVNNDGKVIGSSEECLMDNFEKSKSGILKVVQNTKEKLSLNEKVKDLVTNNKYIAKFTSEKKGIELGSKYLENKNFDFETVKEDNGKMALLFKSRYEKKASEIQNNLKIQILRQMAKVLRDKAGNIDKMTKSELEGFKKEIGSLCESGEELDEENIINELKGISDKIDEQLKDEHIKEREDNPSIKNFTFETPVAVKMDNCDEQRTYMDSVNSAINDIEEDNPYEERSLF